MSSSKPAGGPRIRLEGGGGSADETYPEIAVRFKSPDNSASYDSFGSRHPPVSYRAVVGPYGASVSASVDDGDKDAELNIVEECKGHTPLDDMEVKVRNKQPTIRLVSRCRGMPYGTQAGVIIDQTEDYEEEDDDLAELSLSAPPGIRVIGRCTDHSGGSYSYREEQLGVAPAVGRSGRCRDHNSSRGGVGGRFPEHSGSADRSGRLPAIAHVIGECTHFPDMSETELSYEDDYQTCRMCVQLLHDKARDGAAAGGGQVTPKLARKSSMVHIYADDLEGGASKGQHREKRLCEMKTRYVSKKSPSGPPQPQPPPSSYREKEKRSRAPHKVPSLSGMKLRSRTVSQPASRTHSRPSSSPSPIPSRPSSRQSSRPVSSSPSPSRAGSRSPSMATTAKLEVEDVSWDSSRSSSIEVQVSKQWDGGRRDKGDTVREKRSAGRGMSKKPVAPTPPPEMRYAMQAKLATSKNSLEIVKRRSVEKVGGGGGLPRSTPTSAEMVMRAAWEQYYREYDRYKEEMAEWENVQRKMRKQLARFMSGPTKPPAPPPGIQDATPRASKTALALAADPNSTSLSVGGSNQPPNAEEGMHIRIGLPGRMVKGHRSRSFSVGRPIEDAPPCVQAMYAHPGPFGPPGMFGSQPSVGGPPPPPFGQAPPQQFPPFGRPPGPPFGPFGRPPPPMLMPPPQFGPPGPFGPQQEFTGMGPPRRSVSHIRLNFM